MGFELFGLTSPLKVGQASPSKMVVRAVREGGAQATGYVGFVVFDSSDVSAIRPGRVEFKAADQGRVELSGITFRRVGSHWIEAIDTARPDITGRHRLVTVQPYDLGSGHFYVDAGRGTDSSDPTFGSYLKPWKTIQFGHDQVDAGDTLHVLEGTYREQLALSKGITILGETINRCVVTAAGAGAVVHILPSADNLILGRLTIEGGGTGPNGAGVEIYAADATVINCVVKGFRHGIRVNEPGTKVPEVRNTTLVAGMNVAGKGHGLSSRIASASLQSNLIVQATGCGIYRFNGSQSGVATHNLFWTVPGNASMCPQDPNDPSNIRGRNPNFFNESMFYFGASSPAYNKGPSGAQWLDVDGSPNDIGAYGGPLGELHFDREPAVVGEVPTVAWGPVQLAALLGIGVFALVIGRRPKRRRAS